MPSIKIMWDFGFQVDGGPRTSFNSPALNSPALEVDAYDVVKVTVADSTSETLEIQPATGPVSFVVITSDHYGDKLTYTVDADAAVRKLTGPHVFLGPGQVEFMCSTNPPNKAKFDNTLGKDAQIKIVVGRSKA